MKLVKPVGKDSTRDTMLYKERYMSAVSEWRVEGGRNGGAGGVHQPYTSTQYTVHQPSVSTKPVLSPARNTLFVIF